MKMPRGSVNKQNPKSTYSMLSFKGFHNSQICDTIFSGSESCVEKLQEAKATQRYITTIVIELGLACRCWRLSSLMGRALLGCCLSSLMFVDVGVVVGCGCVGQ